MDLAQFLVIPVALLGAIIGSFLNVVIYRLPRDLSVAQPRWSFCPNCKRRIRIHHNLPILGWLFLRGRCADCRAPISITYPVVEALTAIVFVVTYDALFISHLVLGIAPINEAWPIGLAFLFLMAGLIASAGMDIESYTIDIRVSILMMVAGVIGHAATGFSADVIGRVSAANSDSLVNPMMLPPSLSVTGAAMGLAWLVVWLVARAFFLQRDDAHEVPPADGNDDVSNQNISKPVENPASPLPVVLLFLITLGLTIWTFRAPTLPDSWRLAPGIIRLLIVGAAGMTVLILSSWVTRPADHEIIEELETTRPKARKIATLEFAWLVPAVLAGILLFMAFRKSGQLDISWQESREKLELGAGLASHIGAAVQALGAMVWAAALGWAVRILGTLAFGKEAFGTGDIYLMAAIAAVGGFWMVVLVFFLAAILALLGVLASLFHKARRAIPFGPWLGLATVVGLGVQEQFVSFFRHAVSFVWNMACGNPGF